MRLEISKKTDLALRAVRGLADTFPSEVVKRPRLARFLDTTNHYLPQVMKPLIAAGWVESTPGPTGGYRLIVDPGSISVLELIEAIEGPTSEGCVLAGGPCGGASVCAVHHAWEPARDAMLVRLAQTPLTQPEPSRSTKPTDS